MLGLEKINKVLLNIPGWHTNKKILVIHSDDWGSIRMPSSKVRDELSSCDLIKANGPYCKYDTLASVEDLQALFEVLNSVKDKNGNPAVLTANCLLANPDFEKIKESGFQKYFYEPIDVTFKRYQNEKALTMWNEGINEGVFIPQFHGREHVNAYLWLEKLREGHEGIRKAFDYGVFGVEFKGMGSAQSNLQRAWDAQVKGSEQLINESLITGLEMFYERFGFYSETAIAPNYTWSPNHENVLRVNNVTAMQGMSRQRVVKGPGLKYNYQYRFMRAASQQRLGYQQRNVFFEPSIDKNQASAVSEAIGRIDIAFKMRKPAILGSHRLNYIGVHDEGNRNINLKMLKKLLTQVKQKWPDVEFMSAADLAAIMKT